MSSSSSMKDKPILKLAVPSPLRRLFDYWPPLDMDQNHWETLRPGTRMLVPFGHRQIIGVFIKFAEYSDLDLEKIRHVLAVLDSQPLFPPALMRSFLWATEYYQCPPGEVFTCILPLKLRRIAQGGTGRLLTWTAESKNGQAKMLLARARRQLALWQFLEKKGPLSIADIKAAGFSPALLRQLQAASLVRPQEPKENNITTLHQHAPQALSGLAPNEHQRMAISVITESIGKYGCFLLEGVTGSGKTEVYLQVIGVLLSRGLQALVLVPEIGLTPQTISRFTQRFGFEPAVLHSGLNESERLVNWQHAYTGSARIIIGTRSAVFTPMARPGVIIIDEEHDLSFKQQEGFRYSARDFAIVRGLHENIPVVLGSATPSLESLHNARTGKSKHLLLPVRAGLSATPKLLLESICNEQLQSGFSGNVLNTIERSLKDGSQVIVFINRRGYAPALCCTHCGWVAECSRCDAQMTLHRLPPLLRCHHCDRQQQVPGSCSRCGSASLTSRGAGTQKIEAFLQQRFPGFRILRIDRDSTRRKHSMQSLLDEVSTGNPGILVGTQMLAKGHHFPNVTLVVVLDADAGLFSPDFRGQEQMVQLLLQVAGRAGRESRAGKVIIQTRHAGHPILESIIRQDYQATAQLLMGERMHSIMPPFCHLALFRAEASDVLLPRQFLETLRRRLETLDSRTPDASPLLLTGPLPAPLERRAGRFRMQLLIRCENRVRLQSLLTAVLAQQDSSTSSKKLRWSIDVDPLELI